jgi:hypothetical protein
MPLGDPRDLARTYDSGGWEDQWERVRDYRRTMAMLHDYPDLGTQTLANRLDLPKGTMDSWHIEDVIPDPVRAIRTAYERRWFQIERGSEEEKALTQLIGWLYAKGELKETYRISLRLDGDRQRTWVEAIFWLLNTDVQLENDGMELTPASGASYLGRFLRTLGVKTTSYVDADHQEIPPFIRDGPDELKRDWAGTYLEVAGIERYGDHVAHSLSVKEDSEPWRTTFAAFVEDLTDGEVWTDDDGVYLDDSATADVAPRRIQGLSPAE